MYTVFWTKYDKFINIKIFAYIITINDFLKNIKIKVKTGLIDYEKAFDRTMTNDTFIPN